MTPAARWRAWRLRRFDAGYLRAAHYFGDGWPINCWSCMTPQRARLLEGVLSFDMAFLGADIPLRGDTIDTDDWPDNWGVNASSSVLVDPPEALEVRLELEDWGEVRWLYDLPRS